MTVNPRRVARLQEHGLTEYEARAYLALLELEKAEASQIADVSKVPRTKIYQALENLEEKKLLRVIPERPKSYLVQPIGVFLTDLEQDFRDKAEEVAKVREELNEEFSPKGAVSREATGGFLVLRGRKNLQSQIRDLIQKAEREISAATSEMGGRRLAFLEDAIEARAHAGAVVNLLCPLSERNTEKLQPMRAYTTIRHALVDVTSTTFLFVDDKEVLVIHHVPDDHHYFQGSDVALWTDDPAMVRSLKAMFTVAWSLSLSWEQAAEGCESPVAEAVLEAVARELQAHVNVPA